MPRIFMSMKPSTTRALQDAGNRINRQIKRRPTFVTNDKRLT